MDQGADDKTPLLEVSKHKQGRWLVVQVKGELTHQTCDELAAAFDVEVAAAGAGKPCIAVDTSSLTFFDSAAVRCMVQAHRRVQRQGGEFVVLGTGGVMRRIQRLGLVHVLPVMATHPADSEVTGPGTVGTAR
jgi:anti-anti-sigma factor